MDETILKEFKKLPENAPPPVYKTKRVSDNFTGIMGTDPMSPYDINETAGDYKSITEVMNRKGYSATYPQSYTPIHNYFRNNGIAPYFNPGEDADYASGRLSIAGMIELTATKQPWALTRDQDIEEVIYIAEQYLNVITSGHCANDPTFKEYAAKVRNFLTVMDHIRDKMYKRNGKEHIIGGQLIKLIKKLVRGA